MAWHWRRTAARYPSAWLPLSCCLLDPVYMCILLNGWLSMVCAMSIGDVAFIVKKADGFCERSWKHGRATSW